MSNKAKVGRTHRHASSTKSRKSVVAAGLNTGSARGPKRQVSSGKGYRVMSELEKLHHEYASLLTVLGYKETQFYYRPFGADDATEIEIECKDDIQRLQFKLAACRFLTEGINVRILTANHLTPEVFFQKLQSTQDHSQMGFKIKIDLVKPLAAGNESEQILTSLGVTSPELLVLSKSDIFNLIEEMFSIPTFDRSEYESLFCSSDMPCICSDMCGSLYESLGDITFPPMTLTEFGNVLFVLKYFDSERALATLRRIYSSRCQA